MSTIENIATVKKIFEAYLENRNLRKTPERFAILEEIYITYLFIFILHIYLFYLHRLNVIKGYQF